MERKLMISIDCDDEACRKCDWMSGGQPFCTLFGKVCVYKTHTYVRCDECKKSEAEAKRRIAACELENLYWRRVDQ